jgi:segregation and condensation protein B
MAEPAESTSPGAPSSAGKLAAAFAKLLGGGSRSKPVQVVEPPEEAPPLRSETLVVTPAMVLEGLLFVGQPGNAAITEEQAAAVLGDESSGDIAHLVEELNELYQAQNRPYRIERRGDGFCLALTVHYERLRDGLSSRNRRARLSRTALDVLSVVAYRGPLTGEQIQDHCGGNSATVVRQLVRRDLLAVDRAEQRGPARVYRTTERFLEVFHLANLAELPRSQELGGGDQAP